MDLRAIVARDASWTAWDEPDGPFQERVTDHESWDETLRDRRDLLNALGETIGALKDARATLAHIAGDATYRGSALDDVLAASQG